MYFFVNLVQIKMKNNSEDSTKPAEKTSNNSFKKLFSEFASDTSFGGISKVASSNGIIRRFVWAALSLVCYFFTILMSSAMVHTYIEKPTTTSIRITHVKVNLRKTDKQYSHIKRLTIVCTNEG